MHVDLLATVLVTEKINIISSWDVVCDKRREAVQLFSVAANRRNRLVLFALLRVCACGAVQRCVCSCYCCAYCYSGCNL